MPLARVHMMYAVKWCKGHLNVQLGALVEVHIPQPNHPHSSQYHLLSMRRKSSLSGETLQGLDQFRNHGALAAVPEK